LPELRAYHVVLAVKDEAGRPRRLRRSQILDGCARRDPWGAGNPAHQSEDSAMNAVPVTSIDTQAGSFRSMALARLALSPLNVRQTDAEQGINELAALIRAQGVLQNLTVYEDPETSRRRERRYLVIAGGRRWRALQLLLKQKHITPDYAVPCLVTSYDNAIEISIAENCGRQAMHPADQFEAFRKLIDAGQSVEDVAARFGVAPLIVQRRLKLANVCPDFIALYRKGEITLDHLMAFASTDDHERQRQAWKGLKSHERNASVLRRVLTENEMSAKEPMARFVGLKAYQKAGGQVRRDLFAEDDEAFLLDPALVEKLATEKLETYVAKAKREGAAWVDIAPQMDYSVRAAYGHLGTLLRDPTDEERTQMAALTARQAEIEQQSAAAKEDDDRLDELAEELEGVEDALAAIDEARTVPHPEQERVAGVIVSIGHDGKVHIERGLLKPEDAKRFARARSAQDGTDEAGAPREHSASLVRRLTAHRTLALQASLMQQPEVALAALAHRLVQRTLFVGSSWCESCVRITPDVVSLQQHAADLTEAKAHAAIEAQRERLVAELPRESEALLTWLLGQPQSIVMDLLAFCVALTIDGVKSQEEADASDVIARAAGLDMSEWWTATAHAYFESIPKSRILKVVSEAVSPNAATPLAQLKKSALAKAAEERLAGTRWLPSILRTAAV
jgi:ParB family transcriptional regulator, chromosome partitioning protein